MVAARTASLARGSFNLILSPSIRFVFQGTKVYSHARRVSSGADSLLNGRADRLEACTSMTPSSLLLRPPDAAASEWCALQGRKPSRSWSPCCDCAIHSKLDGQSSES